MLVGEVIQNTQNRHIGGIDPDKSRVRNQQPPCQSWRTATTPDYKK
jgi:hypothetical protein